MEHWYKKQVSRILTSTAKLTEQMRWMHCRKKHATAALWWRIQRLSKDKTWIFCFKKAYSNFHFPIFATEVLWFTYLSFLIHVLIGTLSPPQLYSVRDKRERQIGAPSSLLRPHRRFLVLLHEGLSHTCAHIEYPDSRTTIRRAFGFDWKISLNLGFGYESCQLWFVFSVGQLLQTPEFNDLCIFLIRRVYRSWRFLLAIQAFIPSSYFAIQAWLAYRQSSEDWKRLEGRPADQSHEKLEGKSKICTLQENVALIIWFSFPIC